jgi:hypothetical protein
MPELYDVGFRDGLKAAFEGDVEPPIKDGATAAVAAWIERNHERVTHEAQRRGSTLAEFVVWMLDDVIEIYRDESDDDIAETAALEAAITRRRHEDGTQ